MYAETVIPILPCRALDDILPFYAALGFEQTYRQDRPNPYVALRRGGIELHFGAIPGFDPAESLGNVGLAVVDPAALYAAFAAGLRADFGKVPVTGIPRITRPRKKQGMPSGFSIVDPGGNWLRVFRKDDPGDNPAAPESRLARTVKAAARQADSHGDENAAIRILENGLARHADAPAVQRLPALVYLAELCVRTGDHRRASSLLAEVAALDLSEADRETVAADLTIADELAAGLG
ncbi:VOC family protein [Nocardia sp. NPDC052316]|uniref:VOC family protein n=1 Tax=Nocardia sp. NPDC052316 TaxID=3364329 RepID=UPI0037CBB038